MTQWRVWRDEYWGTTWNNRYEIRPVEVETQDEIVEHLKDQFIEEVRYCIEIDDEEDVITATLLVCLVCDEPYDRCKCEGNGDDVGPWTYVGFHATREEG